MRIDALSIQAVVCLFYDFPCLIHASIGEYSIVLNRIFQPILSQGRHQKAINRIALCHFEAANYCKHLLRQT